MRTLILFCFLLLQTGLFAQIYFSVELQEDEVTYLVKLKPSESYDSPNNITNNAQISFVVPTGGFLPGNIKNYKGKWFNNNNVISPINNPKKDYLVFNLVGHIKDLEYISDEEVVLFSFENVGEKTGKLRFITKNDVKILKTKKLNVGNHISVLGAGFTNAFSGIYSDDNEDHKESPEFSSSQVLHGTFDIDINVEKNVISLEWLANNKGKTASFVIEKSLDGVRFEAIKMITDNFEEALKGFDEAPDFGTNYYRVRQQFTTGEFQYSTVKSEQYLIDEASINMYPNPVKDVLNLRLGHFAGLNGQIRIFNMSGIEMVSQEVSPNSKHLKFNTSTFQNGMYFLIIDGNKGKMIERQFMVELGR